MVSNSNQLSGEIDYSKAPKRGRVATPPTSLVPLALKITFERPKFDVTYEIGEKRFTYIN